MHDFILKNAASAFVDAQSVNFQDMEVGKGILPQLPPGFVLAFGHEVQPDGTRTVGTVFIRPSDGIQLYVGPNRFACTQSPADESGSNMKDFAEFADLAHSLISIPLKSLGRKAHRLAAIRETLLPEMSEQELNAVAMRLLKPPSSISTEAPFEWNWRSVFSAPRRFGSFSEATYTLVHVRRAQGQLTIKSLPSGAESQQTFDRIMVELEINTSPTQTVARFDQADIATYLSQSSSWLDELNKRVDSMIRGRHDA